jgi:ammonium transporter, Amt family
MSLTHLFSAGRNATRSRWGLRALAFTGIAALAATGFCADEVVAPTLEQLQKLENETAYAVDNFFLFICAVLVLFMQAGFAILESGMNEAKNAVNILSKNLVDLCIGGVLYYLIGYGLMYPGAEYAGGFFGFAGVGISGTTADAAPGSLNPQLDFLFQVAFAATAATIVSGAVAGRLKFSAYLIYTVILTGFVYPISGMWKWGGGWLNEMGFYDFAGSIVVHAVGGFAGLAGAIVLGPRIGRFVGGKAQTIPGHSLTFASLGTFILLVGWFGFNPGSQLAIHGAANTNAVALIATNTLLAACAGSLVSLIVIWFVTGSPKLSMALNGMLGGLVGITANCDSVTNVSALIIGGIAGVLVIAACYLLEMLKIDDTVGAFPVHGVCGVWGGIATGIFGGHPLGAQITGSLVIPAYAFIVMFILFLILKAVGCLRVTDEHETKGLDHHEHGEGAYGSTF